MHLCRLPQLTSAAFVQFHLKQNYREICDIWFSQWVKNYHCRLLFALISRSQLSLGSTTVPGHKQCRIAVFSPFKGLSENKIAHKKMIVGSFLHRERANVHFPDHIIYHMGPILNNML